MTWFHESSIFLRNCFVMLFLKVEISIVIKFVKTRFVVLVFYVMRTLQDLKYSLNTFKWHKSNIEKSLMKSSETVFIFLSAFYLIIWLMTSPKNFEKISILKIWQLVFFWGVKIYFGKFLLKWCIFRHGKIWFSQIMLFNSYNFHLM